MPGPPIAGFSFPLVQRAVHTDLTHVGRRVGTLLAANILGSTLGAFLTGWILLDLLGTSGTLKMVFLLSAGFGALALGELTERTRAFVRAAAYAGAALAVAGVVVAMPGGQLLWARLRRDAVERHRRRRRFGSGRAQGRAGRLPSRCRRHQRSWPELDSLRRRSHRAWCASRRFHPSPRSAAVIGLGSGDTLFAMAGRRELEHVTSIEIIAPQLVTLLELADNRVSGVRAMSATAASSTSLAMDASA
jgi:hypothetical protein